MDYRDREFVGYTETTRKQTVTEGIMTAWHAQSRYSLVLTGSVDVTKDKAEADLAKYRYFDDCLAQAVYQLYTDAKDIYYPSSRATTLYFDRPDYHENANGYANVQAVVENRRYLWTGKSQTEWEDPNKVPYCKEDVISLKSNIEANAYKNEWSSSFTVQSDFAKDSAGANCDVLQIWSGIQREAGSLAAQSDTLGLSRFPRDSTRNRQEIHHANQYLKYNATDEKTTRAKLSRAFYDYYYTGPATPPNNHTIDKFIIQANDQDLADTTGAGGKQQKVRNLLRYNVGYRLPESILGQHYWQHANISAVPKPAAGGHPDSNNIGGHDHLKDYKFWDPKGTFWEIPYSTGMGYYDQVDGTKYRKMVPLFNGIKQELKQYDVRGSDHWEDDGQEKGAGNGWDQARSFPNYYVQAWCLPSYHRSTSNGVGETDEWVEGEYGSRMRARIIDNIYAGIGRNDTLTFTATLFRAVPITDKGQTIAQKDIAGDGSYDPYNPATANTPAATVTDDFDGVTNGIRRMSEQYQSTKELDFYTDFSVTMRHYTSEDSESAFGYNQNYVNNLVFPQNGWREILSDAGGVSTLTKSAMDSDGAIKQNNLQHLVEFYIWNNSRQKRADDGLSNGEHDDVYNKSIINPNGNSLFNRTNFRMYLFYPIEASEIHHPYLSNLQRDPANFFNSARFGSRFTENNKTVALKDGNLYPDSVENQNRRQTGYLDTLNIYMKHSTDMSGSYFIDQGMAKFYDSNDTDYLVSKGFGNENGTKIEDYQPIKFEWKYNNVQSTDFVSCEKITINPDYNVLVLVPNVFNPIHAINTGTNNDQVIHHWLSNTHDTERINGYADTIADRPKRWFLPRT